MIRLGTDFSPWIFGTRGNLQANRSAPRYVFTGTPTTEILRYVSSCASHVPERPPEDSTDVRLRNASGPACHFWTSPDIASAIAASRSAAAIW